MILRASMASTIGRYGIVIGRASASVALVGIILVARVPEASGDDLQLWSVVTLDQQLHDRVDAGVQTRIRVVGDVSRARDVLLRPFIGWQVLDNLSLDLGYDYLHAIQVASRSEHRVWQIAEHTLPLGKFDLRSLVRLDQRFIENVSGVVVRLRFRGRAAYTLNRNWYLAFSDEVFLNLNDRFAGPPQGLEQNRVRAALGWNLGRVRVEGAYEWHVSARRGRSDANLHVFALEFMLDPKAVRTARRNH